jgi:hypothetical protein
VAYVVVPGVTRFVGSVAGYNPQTFEPKDAERLSWLDAKGRLTGLPRVSIDLVVNVLLVLLVAVVWLALAPPGVSRRR